VTLPQMIAAIHKHLKAECFTDLVDTTGLAPSTLWTWRTQPPTKPSLKVFAKLAHYCGLNPTIRQLENLL